VTRPNRKWVPGSAFRCPRGAAARRLGEAGRDGTQRAPLEEACERSPQTTSRRRDCEIATRRATAPTRGDHIGAMRQASFGRRQPTGAAARCPPPAGRRLNAL